MTDDRAPRRALVVGSARSGTTLLTRLIGELADVGLCPVETHFFDRLVAPAVIAAGTWNGTSVPPVDRYCRRLAAITDRSSREMADLLEISDPYLAFWRLVQLITPSRDVIVEKTPDHLRWLPYLLGRDPDLLVVAITRRPRDVVASQLSLGWTITKEAAYTAWSAANAMLLNELQGADGDRIFHVDYAELCDRPDSVRADIAGFLGLGGSSVRPLRESELFPAADRRIKADALGPIAARGTEEAEVAGSPGLGAELAEAIYASLRGRSAVASRHLDDGPPVSALAEILEVGTRCALLDAEAQAMRALETGATMHAAALHRHRRLQLAYETALRARAAGRRARSLVSSASQMGSAAARWRTAER